MKNKIFSCHLTFVLLLIFMVLMILSGCNGGVNPIEEVYGTLDINSTP